MSVLNNFPNGPVCMGGNGAAITAPANDTNENTLLTVPLKGVEAKDIIRLTFAVTHTNSANNKTLKAKLNGTTVYTLTTTTVAGYSKRVDVANRNALNSQVIVELGAATFGTAAADLTSGDVSLTLTAQKATGSESFVLECSSVELLRRP